MVNSNQQNGLQNLLHLISGEILEVNEELEDDSTIINTDPNLQILRKNLPVYIKRHGFRLAKRRNKKIRGIKEIVRKTGKTRYA